MSLDEKIAIVRTQVGVDLEQRPAPKGSLNSAGFQAGLPRLGVPPLEETDAELGIATPSHASHEATALPSSLALAATFDPKLAYRAGEMLGSEARSLGFTIVLGGACNLVREPRGGRNFEYLSEDPLLTGQMAGAEIAGVQSQRVVSTAKHFVLNAQENGRMVLNAKLGEKAFRETDLLAFEIALEKGKPGAVMTAYNRVNGSYSSENAHLLTDVLKTDWGFDGWVMSDWGGVHSTEAAALAGLDQESGEESDTKVYYDTPLKAAVEAGRVPMARLDDMVRRILRARFTVEEFDTPQKPSGPIDLVAHAKVTEAIAAQGIVLLKNDRNMLPLGAGIRRVLLVGGNAETGVLSGGGSSQVVPKGSTRFEGFPPKYFWGKPNVFHPSSPVAALRRSMPGVTIDFVDGKDRAEAARRAKDADAVVVFATRWANESLDLVGLDLPWDQDEFVTALAAANSKTVVVLESTGAEAMPWLDAVPAVIEAWYPGGRGGDAIADVLVGKVNPAGRLPVSLPAREADLPRPKLPDRDVSPSYPKEAIKAPSFDIDYDVEGSDVGYRWYVRTSRRPLFPFGFGLSYTHFSVMDPQVAASGGTISVGFDVRNDGDRDGVDTPQVYVDSPAFTRRLVGWDRVALKPGETRHVSLGVDPRLLANFDVPADGWKIVAGSYAVSVREDALADGPKVSIELPERAWSARHAAPTVRSGVTTAGVQ